MVYYILCQHLQLCQNLRLEQRGWGIWSPPSCTTGARPGLLSGVFWKCLLIHFCHSSGFHQGLAFILMLLSSDNPRSSNKELIILYLPLNIQKSEVYLADFFITKTLFLLLWMEMSDFLSLFRARRQSSVSASATDPHGADSPRITYDIVWPLPKIILLMVP